MNSSRRAELLHEGFQEAFERHEAGPGVGLLKQLGVSLEGGFAVSNPDEITDIIAQRAEFWLPFPLLQMHSTQPCWTIFQHERTWSRPLNGPCDIGPSHPEGQAVSSDELQETVVITDLTPELLQGDAWKTAEFRAFDVSLGHNTSYRTQPSHAGPYRANSCHFP